MTRTDIFPIFNQSANNVWDKFYLIQFATIQQQYNLRYSAADVKEIKYKLEYDWYNNSNNFAFGAYTPRGRMVGYINGYCRNQVAFIEGLYVLPDFQKNGTGMRLLKMAESATSLMAKTANLTALHLATKFYERVGYSHKFGVSSASSQYIKQLTTPTYSVIPIFADKPKHLLQKTKLPIETIPARNTPIYVYTDGTANISGYAAELPSGPVVCAQNDTSRQLLAETMQNYIKHCR